MNKVIIQGERGERYRELCGTNVFPVMGCVPQLIEVAGVGQKRAYLMDLAKVEPSVLDLIIARLAERAGVPEVDVRHDVASIGLPIVDEGDCSVMTDMRSFL